MMLDPDSLCVTRKARVTGRWLVVSVSFTPQFSGEQGTQRPMLSNITMQPFDCELLYTFPGILVGLKVQCRKVPARVLPDGKLSSPE